MDEKNKKIKKILFIGDGYPLGQHAGAILYRRIMEAYGIENFCYLGVGNNSKMQWPVSFQKIQKKIISLRIWPNIRGVKYLKKIPFIEELYYFVKIPLAIKVINKFIINNNVDVVFAVLRADVLAVVNKIHYKKDTVFFGFISDTVECEYTDKKIIYDHKYAQYYKAIDKADAIYTAGESMSNFIIENFNKRTSILRIGFANNIDVNNRKKAIQTPIRIFFAGSVYAYEEFNTFISALSHFKGKHSNIDITLITATNYRIRNRPVNININEIGWVKEIELMKIMKDSHIGYIPYKFDEMNRQQMSYAFPNKSGLYLSTGLPLFFHGPDYSSMGSFFQKYNCGIHCASMNKINIIADLERIIFDKIFYENCVREANKAFTSEFTLEVLSANFRKLIDEVY